VAVTTGVAEEERVRAMLTWRRSQA